MADVPAWYWQVLGAVGGLGLGLFIGVLSRRKSGGNPPASASPAVRTTRPGGLGGVPFPAANGVNGVNGAGAVAAGGEPRLDGAGAPQRLLERLREANLDLTAKLRAATDAHARDLLERSQQQQAEQQRHERQIEELRQAHAAELSHLMTAMVEQVDGMQREHAAKLTALQEEVEQLKRLSQTVIDPVSLHMGGDMRPTPPRQP